MMGSLFAYTGVMLSIAGMPLAGVALSLASLLAPAFTSRVAAPASRLDEITPAWQFREYHERHLAAPPERVFAALRQVRADEIALFNALTWIRRFGRPLPPGILNAGREPIIDVALKGGFVALAEDAPRELVVGTLVVAPPGPRPALTRGWLASPPPGFAVGTMNFLVRPDGAGGTWLSTETRVVATDAQARRRFAAYWRVIYPGSAIIRRMWLRAIERRAEEG
jgi:hypothetical protein